MKDIHKNPLFYYAILPFVITLWPLLVWTVYLPNAQQDWSKQLSNYEKAKIIMTNILKLDPDRIDFANSKNSTDEFDYAVSVDKIASTCKIPSTSYNISSRPIRTSGGKKSQSAMISLKDIAHPINADCRQKIQSKITEAFEEENEKAKQPGYKPVNLDEDDDEIPEIV